MTTMIVPLIIFHPTIYVKEPIPLHITINGDTYRNVYRRLATLINNRTFQLAELGNVAANSVPRTSFTYNKEENKNQSLFTLFKYAPNLLLVEINKLTVMPSDRSGSYSSSVINVQGTIHPIESYNFPPFHLPRLKALIISCPKEDAKDLCDMNVSYLTMLTEDEIEDMYKWKN